MSFATLLQRVNTTALKRLGGGTLITLGGVVVAGDFVQPSDQVYLDGASAMAHVPQLTLLSSDVPAQVVGTPVQVDGAAFTVGQAKPDGLGLTVLLLEPVL